jgi:glycerol uptake facilitator-like aquaporin
MLNIARDLGPRLTATILGLGKPTWIQVLLLAVASIVGAVLAGLVVTFLSHFINLSEF